MFTRILMRHHYFKYKECYLCHWCGLNIKDGLFILMYMYLAYHMLEVFSSSSKAIQCQGVGNVEISH